MVLHLKKPYSFRRAIKACLNESRCMLKHLINLKGGSEMTRNQIEYWRHVESKRANRAVERETNRSNLARELETNRANLERERQARSELFNRQYEFAKTHVFAKQQFEEQQRVNRRRESMDYRKQDEVERSNKASEEINRSRIEQSNAQLREQTRANIAGETLTRERQNEQRRLNNMNYDISRYSLSETQRANYAREELESRKIQETNRTNVARENINRLENTIRLSTLAEQTRHNKASEQIDAQRNRSQFISSMFNTTVNALTRTADRKSNEKVATLRSVLPLLGGAL